MGVGTWAYLVDLDQLRSTVGSKDPALLASLEEQNAEYLRQEEERIRDFGDGETSPREALRHLIDGTTPPGCDVGYLMAFEMLCDALGERLDDEDLLGDLWDLEIKTGLLNSGPPILLPGLEDQIGFLTAAQARDEFEQLWADTPSHEDEDIELARRKLRAFLQQAGRKNKALITVTC